MDIITIIAEVTTSQNPDEKPKYILKKAYIKKQIGHITIQIVKL